MFRNWRKLYLPRLLLLADALCDSQQQRMRPNVANLKSYHLQSSRVSFDLPDFCSAMVEMHLQTESAAKTETRFLPYILLLPVSRFLNLSCGLQIGEEPSGGQRCTVAAYRCNAIADSTHSCMVGGLWVFQLLHQRNVEDMNKVHVRRRAELRRCNHCHSTVLEKEMGMMLQLKNTVAEVGQMVLNSSTTLE